MTNTFEQTDELTAALTADLDSDLDQLTTGATRWAGLDVAARAELVRAAHQSIQAHAAAWAQAAIAAKRTPLGPAEGEEWLGGPFAALAGFGAQAESLEAVAAGRSPLDGIRTGTAPGGRATLKLLPSNLQQSLLFHGFSAEVWLRPGVTVAEARANAGLGAARVGENGGTSLVLGAGNVSAIAPLDVLYELVAHNRASILKLNPTFASLIEVFRSTFAPLVEFGVLRIVNGGPATGSYLAHHPKVAHVHITGSGRTHDAIVWGTAGKARGRRAADEPLLAKPITSELGGVSPIIVVPGRWSKADLRYQAESVATQRLQNSGHNCIAGQALILSSDWPQREEFLNVLREVLAELPERTPWYPGAADRVADAKRSYPQAEVHAGRLLIEVDESTSQELLTTEYFAPVLGHLSLPGSGAEFLCTAVDFVNNRLDGTLGAGIVIAPADRKAMGVSFDNAVAELRYGTIGINVWSALGFLIADLPWGAYPGNTLEDVGSGIGIVHNARLIRDAERSVVSGPFRPSPRSIVHGEFALSPKPPWFVTARSSKSTARKLTAHAGQPAWGRLPGIFASAFRA